MASCTVTFTLTGLGGSADAANVFTLRYRQSGVGQYAASGVMYGGRWQTTNIGGTGSAQTVTLEQGEYYDFEIPESNLIKNRCLCPSSSTATLDELLDTAS